MANLERVYTIPLGRVYSMRSVRRAKYAVREIRKFAMRHMKSTEVRIGTGLNERLLRDAMRSPPRKVKVTMVKDESGIVRVNLFGSRPDDAKVAEKAKPAAGKKAEAKKEEKKAAEPVEQKKILSDAEKKAEKEAVKAEMKK
ncbi:MAG: 50S ribosomal protein L31e [Candidatus Burarchaeum sp.]|nr:50S ribosomal protein L31e [Candidatus Burarchaeum sp.]MDO8339455.1 50S ribosomal protein L31e [Candidatus Burarchaeum sp.]